MQSQRSGCARPPVSKRGIWARALLAIVFAGVGCAFGGFAGALQASGESGTIAAIGALPEQRIPETRATAFDGRAVELPRDLPGHISILILGFGRRSADPTTAWEKPIRATLAHMPELGFLDMPMLAEIPGFLRPVVVRSIRKQVPDVLKPNFVPLTADESAWKRLVGYDNGQPDAAYVLLVDRSGSVRWSTHESYTPERFALMAAKARSLVAETR